jgi:hypothetical protein
MSQSVMIFGVPMERANGMPYISVKVEEPIPNGQILTIDNIPYEVYNAVPVTEKNQLQYVYVKEKEVQRA